MNICSGKVPHLLKVRKAKLEGANGLCRDRFGQVTEGKTKNSNKIQIHPYSIQQAMIKTGWPKVSIFILLLQFSSRSMNVCEQMKFCLVTYLGVRKN